MQLNYKTSNGGGISYNNLPNNARITGNTDHLYLLHEHILASKESKPTFLDYAPVAGVGFVGLMVYIGACLVF